MRYPLRLTFIINNHLGLRVGYSDYDSLSQLSCYSYELLIIRLLTSQDWLLCYSDYYQSQELLNRIDYPSGLTPSTACKEGSISKTQLGQFSFDSMGLECRSIEMSYILLRGQSCLKEVMLLLQICRCFKDLRVANLEKSLILLSLSQSLRSAGRKGKLSRVVSLQILRVRAIIQGCLSRASESAGEMFLRGSQSREKLQMGSSALSFYKDLSIQINMKIDILVKLKVNDRAQTVFLEKINRMREAALKSEACLSCEVQKSNSKEYFCWMTWAKETAFRQFINTPAYKSIKEELKEQVNIEINVMQDMK